MQANIVDVEKVYESKFGIAVDRKYEDKVMERLEGWWYRKAIEGLWLRYTNIYITRSYQVRSYIVSTGQEHAADNLPTDIFDLGDDQTKRIECYRQNILPAAKIDLSWKPSPKSCSEWLLSKVFNQRASWVRNNLLYIGWIDKYEHG